MKPVGWLDIEERVPVGEDNLFPLRGWCMLNDEAPPVSGCVSINGKQMGAIQFNEYRPDVLKVHPQYNAGERCGFNVRVPAGAFRGNCAITVQIHSEAGDVHRMDRRVALYEPVVDSRRNQALLNSIKPYQVLKKYPVQAYVEVTTACNLACIMCRGKEVSGKQVSRSLFLEEELFYKLDPMFPHLIKINLNGWGEPTLHKNYGDFIESVRNQNPACEINFTSNFQKISDELMDTFIRRGVSNINVSIDGASADVYEKIRVGGSFQRLLKNIRSLEEKKKQTGAILPNMIYEVVIQKDNITELPDLVKLVYELGGRSLTLEHVVGVPHLEIDYADYIDTFDAAMDEANKLGMVVHGSAYDHFLAANGKKSEARDVSIQQLMVTQIGRRRIANRLKSGFADMASLLSRQFHHGGPPKTGASSIACFEPFQTTFINPDGRITPCCMNSKTMGNLYEESFRDIWLGYEYNMLREQMIQQDYDEECKLCISLGKNIPRIFC